MENYPKEFPAESQNRQPGIESEMNPAPVYEYKEYKGADKLKGKPRSSQGRQRYRTRRCGCLREGRRKCRDRLF